MAFLGILLSFLLGFITTQLLFNNRYLVICLGLSGIIGLSLQTFIMFCLNSLGIIFSASIVLSITAVLIILLSILYFKRYGTFIFSKTYFSGFSFRNEIGYVNMIWIICLAITAYIVYAISAKALFWPTYTTDAITSFDSYAKALAREGKLLNSVIAEHRVGLGAAYPPLYSLGVAYYYQLGFTNANIISIVFIASFAIAFYGLCSRAINSTAAAFFTLGVITIPEFIAQSAVNIPSCPQAVLASLAVMSFVVWYKNKDEFGFFFVSGLLLGLSGFIRSESIVYMMPLFLLVIWCYFRENSVNIKQAILYIFLSATPLVLWQLHLKVHNEIMDKFVQVELIDKFDIAYFGKIWDLAINVVNSAQFYGISKYIIFLTIIGAFIAIRKDKNGLLLLIIIIAAFLGYLALLSLMKLRVDTIENIVNYSGKRFFFGMFILIWFCFGINYYISLFFEKIHKQISKVK